MTVIESFSGQWRPLSNFFQAELVWDGMTYQSSEHAFNAGKSLDPAVRARIAAAATPAKAKELGGPPARGGIVAELRPGWDDTVRYQVMAEVLQAKFTHDLRRTEFLLSTGTAALLEGNTWHDTHWGICQCERHAYGDNHLGRLLMQLRAWLRAEGGQS